MIAVDYMNFDPVIACIRLAERGGAKDTFIGYTNEEAETVEDAQWYAVAIYDGVELKVDGHRSPTGAAMALAERLLYKAMCRCGRPVTLADGVADACRWRLMGKEWKPGCRAAPIRVQGRRGDLVAMRAAVDHLRSVKRPPKRRGANRRRK